jgi:hypothetical protein
VVFGETDQSVLVKLLQQNGLPNMSGTPPATTDSLPLLSKGTTETPATSLYHAHKRCSLGPADDSNPKRMKTPSLKMPNIGPLATRITPLKPSRGATSSLMELLTERPMGNSQHLSNQTSSVLQNLLVSGHDLQTGHDLQKRHSSFSCKAVTSSCFVSLLPSSRLSLEKVFFSLVSLSSSVVCFHLQGNPFLNHFFFHALYLLFSVFLVKKCIYRFFAETGSSVLRLTICYYLFFCAIRMFLFNRVEFLFFMLHRASRC